MKKNILIVDNDQLLNKINEKVLVAADVVRELHIAANGRDALDHLTSRLIKNKPMPDIIILDLHLPVMNGFDFLDEFQKIDFAGKNSIELVVFTSSSNPKDRQRAFSKGIKHYLSKPYLLRGLINVLQPINPLPGFITTRDRRERRVK